MTATPPDWVQDAVFYEVFPDRFRRSGRVRVAGAFEEWDAPPTVHGFKGGDLFGVIERLDALLALGISALYLTPVFESASNHRYHTVDYLHVDRLLGGDAALRELLDAAHGRGMRVVLDGVFNHSGRGFWPFHHVLETGKGSPYRDWFHLDPDVLDAGRRLDAFSSIQPPSEVVRPAAGPPDDSWSLREYGYRAWRNLPALPRLNIANPEVRAFLFEVAERWIRFGADGWRLDVAAQIDDDEFWREFRRRVRAVNPEAYIVAEIWREAPRWLQGDQFDALTNYPLAEAAISFCGGDRLDLAVVSQNRELGRTIRPEDGPTFARRLDRLMHAYDPAVTAAQLNLLGSHDTPRLRSMLGGDLDGVRLAMLVQMTVPGAPCIYYGDELGVEGGMDPGCRAAYPRDETAGDVDLREFVAGAIALREAHPALRRGSLEVVGAEGSTCAYRLSDGAEWVTVVLNAGAHPASLRLVVPEVGGRSLVQETWPGCDWPAPERTVVEDGRVTIHVPGRRARVLRAA